MLYLLLLNTGIMDYEVIIRFLLAALWGGLVGAQREYWSKSAGFRTIILISIGSCFFTMMSQLIGGAGNPDRIASNIVSGIGFLGAGVIFRGENRINGITTAATIWVVAAVGMGIGSGHYFDAGVASILILIVLAVLPRVERVFDAFNHSKTYHLKCTYRPGIKSKFEAYLNAGSLKYQLIKELKEAGDLELTWQVYGHLKRHERFIADIMEDADVRRFEY